MLRKIILGFCYAIFLFLLNIDATEQQTNNTETIFSSQNSYGPKLGLQHVLSRRKRYLIFPPGSAFVATMSFAKALATDYPRGVNFVVETDFYYPMYSSISELFPKEKKPTPKPKPIATTTAIPMEMIENPKFDSFPGTYIDSSDFWERKDGNTIPNYNHEEYIPLSPSYKYWQSPNPYFKRQYQPTTNYVSKPIYHSPDSYSNEAIYPHKYRDWKYRQHELYRSRRDLYGHIEGMAEKHGFEIKTCIHRMICEGRHYLLPRGISFFQDVLRILLTLPVTNDIEDGYNKAQHASEDECLLIYGEKCPYSIIGYILHSQQEMNK